MKEFNALLSRNIKLFFRDKGLFFSALATPMILLVLYATFLGNIYTDTFNQVIPEALNVSSSIVKGLVGGQLLSSLLAVCCVTTSFNCNMVMVQDKVTGAIKDITITPVKKSTLALSYYATTLICSLIVCLAALCAGLIYIATIGFYLTVGDVLLLVLDIFIVVMFGTALSSIINIFLTSHGQIATVSSIISSLYGFLCGAYMPISNFGEGLQKFLSFLPGTYSTSLFRNHTMNGAFSELAKSVPDEFIKTMRDVVDANIYFFDNKVSVADMYIILVSTVIVLLIIYIVISKIKGANKNSYEK